MANYSEDGPVPERPIYTPAWAEVVCWSTRLPAPQPPGSPFGAYGLPPTARGGPLLVLLTQSVLRGRKKPAYLDRRPASK